MSLREQLLAKGLVSKKQARRAERELKQARKKKQGRRRKKAAVRAEQEAEEAAARRASLEARRARKLEREEAKAQVERALRVRNLVWGNRVQAGGKQPFWHRSLDGRRLLRMEVSRRAAEQLRRGELAIAAFDHGTRLEYVVLRGDAARKLRELGSGVVVFLVDDVKGILDPENDFLRRTWETDLRPHRKRA